MLSKVGGEGRTGDLGDLLRGWRSMRGKSQLDLSMEAAVSQRHLSFIESGRSAPGREKLMDIAEALDIPFRERNTLLLAAGYAPTYPEGRWDGPPMKSITAAIQRMLKQQEPFPAVLMDRYWNVLATNDAAPRFFGAFIDLSARPSPRNLLHLMFDPAGMRPFIRDWDRTATSLIGRVRREAVGRIVDEKTQELLDALTSYAGVGKGRTLKMSGEDSPVIPLSFEKDGVVLNYFSMVSTIGTPTTVTSQESRVEAMFPADDITESRHLDLLAKV